MIDDLLADELERASASRDAPASLAEFAASSRVASPYRLRKRSRIRDATGLQLVATLDQVEPGHGSPHSLT